VLRQNNELNGKGGLTLSWLLDYFFKLSFSGFQDLSIV